MEQYGFNLKLQTVLNFEISEYIHTTDREDTTLESRTYKLVPFKTLNRDCVQEDKTIHG